MELKDLGRIKKGFLVVRRLKTEEIKTIQLQKVLDNYISPSDIYTNYRGIEGEKWPFIEGEILSEIDIAEIQFDEAYNYYKANSKLNKDEKIDFLYIETCIESEADVKGYKDFDFYGFDYGTFIDNWNNYSILFNEILFGKYDELKASYDKLNQNLLFPSLETLFDLDKERNKLIIAGADLETAETDNELPKAIAVFGSNLES